MLRYLFIVAIDLTVLAESIPRSWTFILSGLASIWGLGNAITGLIGNSSGWAIPQDSVTNITKPGRYSSTLVAQVALSLPIVPKSLTWDGGICI